MMNDRYNSRSFNNQVQRIVLDPQRNQLTNRAPRHLDDQQQDKRQEGPEQKGMGHLDAGQLAMGPGVVVPHGKQQFLHQLGLGIGLAPQARQVTGVDPA